METCILTYEQIDQQQWSALVDESRTGTWFQSPEAYALSASMPDLFRPFAIAVERFNELTNERTLRAVCVGYMTKEKNPIRQYFTRRAIILGGPVLADDCTDEEVESLMIAVRKQFVIGDRSLVNDGPIYIETRNFNDYSRWRKAFERAGFEYYPHLNFHVDCTDKEAMWERMSENRKRQVRQQPTRTRPDGKASYQVSEEEIIEWYGILSELYRTKVKTPLFPMEFFLEAYRQGVGQFLLVKHKGKVIGGSMVVVGARGVYEWFECGLNSSYKEQYPSVIATWAGMEYTHTLGIALYDMMGAGVPDVPYGVRDFKREFGGELVEHGRYLYICHPWLYRIGKMGVKVLKTTKK